MRDVWEYIKAHKELFIGGSIGLTIGIMMLVIGFWATLLLAITTGLGALLVGMPEKRAALYEWVIGIFKKIFKRN